MRIVGSPRGSPTMAGSRSGSAAGRRTATGVPSIQTVLRPSLRRTNPVTAGCERPPLSTAACVSGSPRRRRSRRSRSCGVVKSVPSASRVAAAAGIAENAIAIAARILAGARMFFLEGDPLERAVGLDARLDGIGARAFDPPHCAAIDGIEALRISRERVDEAEEVALVERARLELHAAREHVHRVEHPAAGEQQRALRRDLVVERRDLVFRAQRVDQLHQVEAVLALQHAALDEGAEHVGGFLEAVTLAARAVQPRARFLEVAARIGAVELLLDGVPARARDDARAGEERESEEYPCHGERAAAFGAEELVHAGPGRSRTMRSTKRGSMKLASRSAWRPCSADVGLVSSGLSITSARKPSTRPMSAASLSTSAIAPRKSFAETRTVA